MRARALSEGIVSKCGRIGVVEGSRSLNLWSLYKLRVLRVYDYLCELDLGSSFYSPAPSDYFLLAVVNICTFLS